MCRAEHGIGWDEFLDLTLAQLEALEERRRISIRHARFNAALITSVIFNAHRAQDRRAMSPFDLVPGYEEDPADREKQELRDSIKHGVALAFMDMKGKTREEVLDEKRKMIERMRASGVEDPEEIIREVYPDL